MLILPDRAHIQESLGLSQEYGLGFEYNDFYMGMDDQSAIDECAAFYLENRPPRPCTMHGAFYDVAVASVDEQIRAVSQRRVKQSVEICRRLGAKAAVFHTNTIPGLANLPAYAEPWLNGNALFYSELLEANRDVGVYIENMFDQTPELLRRLAERLADHPNFGVCLDFAHASISPTGIERWFEALAPYIQHCHINDCDGIGDLHWPLDRGALNIPRFIELLEKYGVTASVVIEVKGADAQRGSLEYLRRHAGLSQRVVDGY